MVPKEDSIGSDEAQWGGSNESEEAKKPGDLKVKTLHYPDPSYSMLKNFDLPITKAGLTVGEALESRRGGQANV